MGNMDGCIGNATPTTSWDQLHWWKSPRWIMIRIESLAVVAIIISFFLAAFGSCRRWSNRWIVQKGFFAAQVLSLSLGTYSIGLMQSSSVKSEMYPIWTVSLFSLIGCIDPVIANNGLDYKGPLSKMVYGICLQFGYVMLMSISIMSGGVGKTAIIMLSVITFIKCFHRSLALIQQSRMRNMVQDLPDDEDGKSLLLAYNGRPTSLRAPAHHTGCCSCEYNSEIEEKMRGGEEIGEVGEEEENHGNLIVDFHRGTSWASDTVNISEIRGVLEEDNEELRPCYDACVAFGLSHKLQQHFLGLDRRPSMEEQKTNNLIMGSDFRWALKVIEIELAFLYDVFFSGTPFLHYYQAKTASLWALASFIGICFVGVAAAIPGTIISRPHATPRPGGCTYVVDSTTVDIVITVVILVSLAMLQLMHLIRCWTSNWARVAIACAYARDKKGIERNFFRHIEQTTSGYSPEEFCYMKQAASGYSPEEKERSAIIQWWMRTKGFVATSTNWFDKYLWQDKIGQYSVLPEVLSLTGGKQEDYRDRELTAPAMAAFGMVVCMIGTPIFMQCARLVKFLGLDYVWAVLRDLLGSDSKKRAAIRLDDDVKTSIVRFLDQIKTKRLDDHKWLCFRNNHPIIKRHLPYYKDKVESHGYRYTSCVMVWHIATWYCELVEQEWEKQANKEHRIYIGCRETAASYLKRGAGIAQGCFPSLKKNAAGQMDQNRRVANALSMYCAYLVVSAPELLPGSATETNSAYNAFRESVKASLFFQQDSERLLGAMSDREIWKDLVSAAQGNWGQHIYETQDYSSTSFCYFYRQSLSSEEADPLPLFWDGVGLAKLLLGDNPPLSGTTRRSDELWDTLARVWVRLLVYAAPYGNAEAHMRHLAKGGEFITHLWALLFHLDIREWERPEEEDINSIFRNKKGTLQTITTMGVDEMRRMVDAFTIVVVGFVRSLPGPDSDELATASKLEHGVKFFQTSSPDVARLFHIDPEPGHPALVLLNKEAEEIKFTLYDGRFCAYDIAYFATSNKRAFAKTRAQGTASSSVDNPIKKQSLEDGGQTEDEIGKESSFGDGGHGQTKGKTEEEISPSS